MIYCISSSKTCGTLVDLCGVGWAPMLESSLDTYYLSIEKVYLFVVSE
jgi:hypothetical protein